MIQKNLSEIKKILCSDIKYAIQCVYEIEENPLTRCEYRDLMQMSYFDATYELIDKIRNKGEKICRVFLSLLKDAKLTDKFPDLKKLSWYGLPAMVFETETEGFRFMPGMSFTEILRLNKLRLLEIIMSDVRSFISFAFQSGLVGNVGYRQLMDTHSNYTAAVELLDKMTCKGEEFCHGFIAMLQNNEVTAIRPELEALPYAVQQQGQPGYLDCNDTVRTAQENIRKNKTTLQNTLMLDIDNLFNLISLIYERKLITPMDTYRISADPATELVDIIMGKGESTCNAFLDILKSRTVIKMFPTLKTLLWDNSSGHVIQKRKRSYNQIR